MLSASLAFSTLSVVATAASLEFSVVATGFSAFSSATTVAGATSVDGATSAAGAA